MNHYPIVLAVLLPLLMALSACDRGGGTGGSQSSHAIRGKVVSVDPAKGMVTLDHEEIPGVMGAMKMPFKVENQRLLEGLKAGDAVEGRLVVKDGAYILTELRKR